MSGQETPTSLKTALFPFSFTVRTTTMAALLLCRTVCYLYQPTEPLHKLNPNISKPQCVVFFFFFKLSHYQPSVPWVKAAATEITRLAEKRQETSQRKKKKKKKTMEENTA